MLGVWDGTAVGSFFSSSFFFLACSALFIDSIFIQFSITPLSRSSKHFLRRVATL